MSSIWAVHRKPRQFRRKNSLVKSLRQSPQRQGVCMQILSLAPKKPNSAKRKAARVALSTRREVFAYIPGMGHNLVRFAHVLVRGGIIPDLPGVHYTLVRGAKDLQGLPKKTGARSKYGTKLWRRVTKKNRRLIWSSFKKKTFNSGGSLLRYRSRSRFEAAVYFWVIFQKAFFQARRIKFLATNAVLRDISKMCTRRGVIAPYKVYARWMRRKSWPHKKIWITAGYSAFISALASRYFVCLRRKVRSRKAWFRKNLLRVRGFCIPTKVSARRFFLWRAVLRRCGQPVTPPQVRRSGGFHSRHKARKSDLVSLSRYRQIGRRS